MASTSSELCAATQCGDATDVDEENGASPSSASSLLAVLRAPRPSELARKRKIALNPPHGKRRCGSSSSSSPSSPASITPAQHVKEFPNDKLMVLGGKLFCCACRETRKLSRKLRETRKLHKHVSSQKHDQGKKKLKANEMRERDIAQMLNDYNQEHHLVGVSLSEQQQVYRVMVLTAFLKAGVPLNRLHCFRELLEENAVRLTDKRHNYV